MKEIIIKEIAEKALKGYVVTCHSKKLRTPPTRQDPISKLIRGQIFSDDEVFCLLIDYFREGINGDVFMKHVNMCRRSSYLIMLLMSKVFNV